ncbi:hypothetical protein AB0C21_27875 [Spirillospora sp. NPDC049024]
MTWTTSTRPNGPLHDNDLPASTYGLLLRAATAHPDQPALHLLGEDGLP